MYFKAHYISYHPLLHICRGTLENINSGGRILFDIGIETSVWIDESLSHLCSYLVGKTLESYQF